MLDITFKDMAGKNASPPAFIDISCHIPSSSSFFVFENCHYLFFETACMLCYVMLFNEKFNAQCFFKTISQDMTYKMYVISQNLANSLHMTYKHNIQTYKFGGG